MSSDNYEECSALQALIQANATILYPKYETRVITYNQGQGVYACVVGIERPTFVSPASSWAQSSFGGGVGTYHSTYKLQVLLEYEAREPSWGLKGSLEHLLRQTQKDLGKKSELLAVTST
ncbi:hypothetical protein CC79DRAFT_1353358 [Sarocladium strictum]